MSGGESLRARADQETAVLLGIPVEQVTPMLRGFAAAWFDRPDLLSPPVVSSSPVGEGDGGE